VLLYREPNIPGIRIDSGIREGDQVGVHYDPLLAKVIATAETREVAVERLLAALRAFPILGIRSNVPFLIRVLDSAEFRAGTIHTRWLDGDGAALASDPDDPAPDWLLEVITGARDDVHGALDRSAGWNGRDPWATARQGFRVL
jgi:acetyl/propionyl-CoA carboxylase alpha subunit